MNYREMFYYLIIVNQSKLVQGRTAVPPVEEAAESPFELVATTLAITVSVETKLNGALVKSATVTVHMLFERTVAAPSPQSEVTSCQAGPEI